MGGRVRTQEETIAAFKKVHGNKYDYSLFSVRFMRDKGTIICSKHGEFKQVATTHLLGKGCKQCANENHRMTKKRFFERCHARHGDKYDYSLAEYDGVLRSIKVICPVHGVFNQQAGSHLYYGCEECGVASSNTKNTSSTKTFICKAEKKHGKTYDYSKTEYIRKDKKVMIICRIHGQFEQAASSHLGGSGCPKCACKKSKVEQEFLDYHNVPIHHRQFSKVIGGKRYYLDGFDPVNGIVYEFHGDFWHVNPAVFDRNLQHPKKTNTTYGELYDRTIFREEEIRRNGYTVVSVWESDWLRSAARKEFLKENGR